MDKKQAVIELRKQGLTKTAISETLKIPRTTVRRWLEKFEKGQQRFKVGDRVRVTGKGSRDIWYDDMVAHVGAVGTVFNFGGGNIIGVEFDNDIVLWFNHDNLDLVSEDCKQTEAVSSVYNETTLQHDPSAFLVGDEVVICKKVVACTGWYSNWVPEMDKTVGRFGEVVQTQFGDFRVRFSNHENDYYYPSCALMLKKDYKKETQKLSNKTEAVTNVGSETISTDAPLSETIIPKCNDGTREELIEDLRALAIANPEKVITRNYYRVHGSFSESNFSKYFGSFHEFKRQAGIVLSRQQHHLEKQIAKHASVDHYRKLDVERKSYGDKYDKPNSNRFKQVLICGDLHDKNVDKFYLSVLIDTVKRTQPDVVVFNGDIFDAPEFSRFSTDPRDFDVVGRIKFVHENIFKPIREAAPEASLDFIEGNHEFRILRHLADATPALRCILSDLHGMSVSTLLGLDEFEMNYIAKGSLHAYTIRDKHKEISKNYKVYFDSFIVSHETDAKKLGYPGVNGHHHKTSIESMYNEHFGAYSWIHHGCGHKLDAEYCHPKWNLGFVIATCDTLTKQTFFDTVSFSENFVFVGGKFYER